MNGPSIFLSRILPCDLHMYLDKVLLLVPERCLSNYPRCILATRTPNQLDHRSFGPVTESRIRDKLIL